MTIKLSTALRNEYLQISLLVKETGEPIFITNKGEADGVFMNMKNKLIYLPEADRDILEIVRFHTEKLGAKYAGGIYQTLREEISRLRDFPLLGQAHPDPELAVKGHRKLVLTNAYVSVCKVTDSTVFVYSIVNSAKDYPKLLK